MIITVKTAKINSIFLAIVLITGTFAAVSPSFITGVNAEPYYGMDKDRKLDKKDVSVQSLKCNNINVNVNGLELDVLPSFLGDEVTTEAAEGSNDASSFAASNNGDGSQINDFRFICINNNNNTVIEAETPEPETCEDCFARELNSTQFAALQAALRGGLEITLGGPAVITPVPIVEVNSFAELCALIEANPLQIQIILQQVLAAAGVSILDLTMTIIDLVSCLEVALGIDINIRL